jgi:hypothetical protein
MKAKVNNILLSLGFSEDQSNDLANQTILLSLKETLAELLSEQDFSQLDKEIEAKAYKMLDEYIQKLDKTIFEQTFTKRIVENIKIILDSIYKEVPEDLKEDFVELIKEIQSKNLAEILKAKEAKIEDVLKSIAN